MFLLTVYGLQCISGVITGCGENKWSLDTWFTVSAIYGFFYCFIAMITLSEKSISPCVYGFCFVVNAVSVVWQFVLLGVPMKGCWSPLFEANYIISWFTLVPIVYLMWGIMDKSAKYAIEPPVNYGAADALVEDGLPH
jgi:hypothetical protein